MHDNAVEVELVDLSHRYEWRPFMETTTIDISKRAIHLQSFVGTLEKREVRKGKRRGMMRRMREK